MILHMSVNSVLLWSLWITKGERCLPESLHDTVHFSLCVLVNQMILTTC
jgi:hypothetical protein